MTDHDADEIVPQRKRSARIPLIDKALGVVGLALAGVGVFFPWYAFLHQDKFSMPTLWQGNARNVPGRNGTGGAAPSAIAAREMDPQTQALVDELFTATVPSAGADQGEDDLQQPFPAATPFKLMHVANGRALIEDKNGMYIVRVGGALPDDSRLSTLEERDGRWVMITSRGDVFKTE